MNYGKSGLGGATKSSGYSKVLPSYGKAVAPGYGLGKFSKPVAPFGKPVAPYGFGKPAVGGYGGLGAAGKYGGFPATKSTGFNTVVPTTTVVTSPNPYGI